MGKEKLMKNSGFSISEGKESKIIGSVEKERENKEKREGGFYHR